MSESGSAAEFQTEEFPIRFGRETAEEKLVGRRPVTAADKARQPVLRRPLSRRDFLKETGTLAKAAVAGAVIAGSASTADLEIKASRGLVSKFFDHFRNIPEAAGQTNKDIPAAPFDKAKLADTPQAGSDTKQFNTAENDPQSSQNILQVNQESNSEIKNQIEKYKQYKLADKEKAEPFLVLLSSKIKDGPVFTLDEEKEEEIVHIAISSGTVSAVDMAMQTVLNRDLRTQLLKQRFHVSQQHFPVPQSYLDWAKNWNPPSPYEQGHEIKPETLALAYEAEVVLRSVLEVAKGDLGRSNETTDTIIPHPEILAALQTLETTGFTHLGDGIAYNEINPDFVPQDRAAEVELCRRLTERTGFTYDPQTLPGSERGDPAVNQTGGALSPQILPSSALELDDLTIKYKNIFDQFSVPLTIFDPIMAFVQSGMFFARQQQVTGGIRYGWKNGDTPDALQAQKFTEEKWNPSEEEDNYIQQAKHDYEASVKQASTP